MITQEDLLKEMSLEQLTELSDLNATGVLDEDVIEDCINDAISFIESFIILPLNPTPLLKNILVDFTIYELKKRNGLISEDDKETKKENESYLNKMSTGRLKLEIEKNQTASVYKENKSFAFRHRTNRKVNTRGFR
ncbi:phage protein Gp36 family protein [Malaciobacter marinus]|uniref:phage protein Gp36 family protein n=1 Tax=Malaciobacter marinus TaxID=505249 RepID=UPI003AFF8A82